MAKLRKWLGKMQNNTASPCLRVLSEDVISMSKAARLLGRHVATVHRYRTRGVDGTKLETCRIGGRFVTSTQAVTRFLDQTHC